MKKLKYAGLLLVASSLVGIMVSCDGGNNVVKDEYDFTYNFNYEGATNRTIKVKHGKRATSVKASRTGYTFDGWFDSVKLENEFDFSQYIYSDTEVYAKWTKDPTKYKVTLDFNYSTAGSPSVIEVEEGSLIKETLIPSSSRFGYVYEGWYKDAICTQKWDFSKDVVTADITLYAKYTEDPSVQKNSDGSIKYENVRVNLFDDIGFGVDGVLNNLISKFNNEYKGKIKVIKSTSISSQDDYCLRYQQTPAVNGTYGNYYDALSVLDFAQIDLDKDDFIENATRENYIDGQMTNVPIFSSVPTIVYNKELMEKYNPTGNKLTTYSEFSTVLKAAYTGESESNSSFKSILASPGWTFKEGTAQSVFFQNDADFYTLKDGTLVNEWDSEEGYKKAENAMTAFYNLFGKNGECHGGLGLSDSFGGGDAISKVKNKECLMAIADVPYGLTSKDSAVEYIPVSGLFNVDSSAKQKNEVSSIATGFGFYKAKNVTLTQIAAAAEFVKYISDNSLVYAKNLYIPLRKSLVESDDFKNSTNENIKICSTLVNDINDIRTLDGCVYEKEIFNKVVSEGVLVPCVEEESEEDAIDNNLLGLRESISSLIGG